MIFGSFSSSLTGGNPYLPQQVGILGGTPEESQRIEHAIAVSSSESRGLRDYTRGTLAGLPVTASFSRWGKVAAASSTTTLIESDNADFIISVGTARSADPSLKLGDILVAEHAVQHDLDASALPPFSRFEIPLLDIMSVSSEIRHVDNAVQAAREYLHGDFMDKISSGFRKEFGVEQPNASKGTLASGDRLPKSPGEIQDLKKALPGLSAIDMEGAAIAQVCHEHGLPFVIFRTISEPFDAPPPSDAPRFLKEVTAKVSVGLLHAFLGHLKAQASLKS